MNQNSRSAPLVTFTNAAAPCCRNPMGLDNIALTR
jgi:hypothetical protein